MQLLNINKLNQAYEEISGKKGLDFIDAALQRININLEINPNDLKKIPITGAFITVSNHPFGFLDGMLLLKIIAQTRPDFKVMANFLLSQLHEMQDYFISVNPLENINQSSTAGVRACVEHLQKGYPLGIFPAGEVSTYQFNSRLVQDKEWNETAIKIIKRAKVPIVPVYFEGQNSLMFHLLGSIHPALRTVQIPNEYFRKRNKTIKIRIGKPISVKEQDELENLSTFSRYLRARTYLLGLGLEDEKSRFNIKLPKRTAKPKRIAEPLPNELLCKDIDNLTASNLVHTLQQFEVYACKSYEIPHLIHEIGRQREITFRAIGEGSNRSIDLDEFDNYYTHLFIWDKEAKALVGSYRLGIGTEIFKRYGRKGFYINQFFEIDDQMNPIFAQSLEMGRSFVVQSYQKKPQPLLLLWKGIMYILFKSKTLRYVIGTVSMSNDYTLASKSLVVEFLKQHCYDNELAKHIKSKHPFVPNLEGIDVNIFLEQMKDIDQLDKIISEIEVLGNKMPVLIKRYLKMNAKMIAFNVDPDFNNSLDGFMILDMSQANEEMIENLKDELKL